MRFQTTNQVPCEDAELVLAVLEERLHTLSHEVVREGGRITLFGLGPSPRVVNPRDKTMIDVSAADGVTRINADVTFQASAFLGEVAQDKIVLEKLESVFEEIKAELDLKTRGEDGKVVPVPERIISIESAKVEWPVAVASAPEDSGITEPSDETTSGAYVLRAVVEEPPIAEIERSQLEVPVASDYEQPIEATPIAAATPIRIVFVETDPISVAKSLPSIPPVTKPETERWVADAWRRARWAVAGVCLAAIVVVGARGLMNRDKAAHREAEPVAIAVPASAVIARTVSASTTVPVSGAKPSLPGDENPAAMMKQWELAMQSRDAEAQAAFYADTVSRYFLRSKVERDAVLADKQAAIGNRKDGWTFKTERVKVQRSADSATVMLLKHFSVEKDGTTVSEWFIPSQLKLKREDGRWRIVSERDLGWATSIDDLNG